MPLAAIARSIRSIEARFAILASPGHWRCRSANEAAPLVHDGVLFIEGGNMVEAINAADGSILWQYIRALPDELYNGRDARMKGLAIYEQRLYDPTADGHTVPLNARTSELRRNHAGVA